MKNEQGNLFGKIQEQVDRLAASRERFEAEADDAKKEIARKRVIESVVFHETKIPLRAIRDIVDMSTLKMGRKPMVNNMAAMTAIDFNLELVDYIQSYLSPDFDSSFTLDTEFDAKEIIFTALLSAFHGYRKKSVTITTRFHECPLLVNTDKYKLYCILLNLLDNALKFSRSGDEMIVGTSVTPDGMLRIEFIDHGEGFDREQMKAYFPDGRLSVSVNEYDQKTGLLIIYKYLSEMGGYLELESRPAEGSALSLYVRLSECAETEKLAAEVPQSVTFSEKLINQLRPDRSLEGGLKRQAEEEDRPVICAVIVDDDPQAAGATRAALESVQAPLSCVFNINTVTPSKDAIADIAAMKPDIIFIEPMMKAADGFEMLAAIKGDPAIMTTPVIAVSRIKCQNRAMKLGANGYVTKPVNASSLIAATRSSITHKLAEGLDFDRILSNIASGRQAADK